MRGNRVTLALIKNEDQINEFTWHSSSGLHSKIKGRIALMEITSTVSLTDSAQKRNNQKTKRHAHVYRLHDTQLPA